MNEHDLANVLSEVAADVPDRTDEEATVTLRDAIDRNRRRRRRFGAVLTAAAAALIALVAWIAIPNNDDVGVTSDGPSTTASPSTATSTTIAAPQGRHRADITVDADLGAYTGIVPPLVTVSTDGRHVQAVDVFDLRDDPWGLEPFATVDTGFPVSWAAAGPDATNVFVVDATDSTAMLIDLTDGDVVGQWPDTRSIAVSHDGRYLARVEDRPDGTVVVVEDLHGSKRLTLTARSGRPHPSGPLSWSAHGRLAIGQDDDSVVVVDPDTTTDYPDTPTVAGPLVSPVWVDDAVVAGTSDCCSPSPIVTVDLNTGTRAIAARVDARQVVAVDGGGSPWGWIYLDPAGAVRGLQGPDGVLLDDIGRLHW